MKKSFKIIAAAMALAMAFAPAALAACGGGEQTPPSGQTETVNVTGVTLASEGSAVSLGVGETLQLTATVAPSDATNKNVTFSTSAASVATVSASGLVTGVAAGSVTITVKTADGGFTDTIELTVTAAAEPETDVTSVTVTPQDVTFAGNVQTGGSVAFNAAVAPDDATDKTLTWTAVNGAEDASDALAEENGSYVLTPTEAGDYTVRATAASGVYGEYSVKAYAAKTTLTGENAQLIGCTYNTNEGCIGGIQKGVSIITFTIDSEVAQTVTLEAGLAVTSAADTMFSKHFSVKVNDSAVTPERDEMYCGTNYGWSDNGTVSIGNVSLIPGENTIVFTAAADVNTNIYYLSVFGEAAVTEVIPQSDDPITEGTENIFEGETAAITSGSMGSVNVNNSDANAHGGTSLGNVNNNNGATLTFTVSSAEACKAGLYACLAFGGKTMSGIFTLTVNGKAVPIPASFTATGEANWATYEEYWLANIDLVAGENTIVLTVTGGCGNFDYINIIAPCTVSAAQD